MIKKQSDDPNVQAAANHAAAIVQEVLSAVPKATVYDYGGHILKLGEYDVCQACTSAIAEAQQAQVALIKRVKTIEDPVVAEHIELAIEYFQLEADTATVRAEFHNGHGSEQILNGILGHVHERSIHDSYGHSHESGE